VLAVLVLAQIIAMTACVAARDRFWTDMPMKVELSASHGHYATADFSDMGRSRLSSIGMTHLASETERMIRLRLRTESSFGMPVSPYIMEPKTEEPWLDQLAESRYRCRTASALGMPMSPWSPQGDVSKIAAGELYLRLLAASMPAADSPVAASIGQQGLPLTQSSLLCAELVSQKFQAYPAKPRLNALNESLASPLQSSRTSESSSSVHSAGEYTSMMLRNLPQGFTRRALLELLEQQGFAGRYDFVYLPVNFESMAGLSPAFVNMVSPADAQQFLCHFQGFSQWAVPSDSICEVVWNDKNQGLTALVARYRNSPVMHESVPEDCKPVLLRGGWYTPFPPPTQRIKAPKMLKHRA